MADNEDIMEVHRFMDSHGREVQQFSKMFGKKEPPFYRGRVMVKVQPVGPNGPMPPQLVPFEFMFPEGVGLKRAFEVFDETAKKEVDEHAKKMKEQAAEKASEKKIVAATSMPRLVGANGKPL